MAIGTFTLLDQFRLNLGSKLIDLSSDSFNLALTTSSQALTAAFAGSSGHAKYADLTDELSDASYTTGGNALSSVTWTTGSGVAKFDAADVTFTALSGTFKYGVVYQTTGSDKYIVGFVDYNTTGSIVQAGTDFENIWDTSGIFTSP